MPEVYLFLLFALAALYLSVMVHELGHALAGKAAGFVVTSLGLGIAKPVLNLPIGGTRYYLALSQPFQGITFAFLPRYYADWRRMAVFVSGGIIANALCAIASICLAYSLTASVPSTLLAMFAGVNAFIGAMSLLPIRVNVGRGVLRSDGRILLDTFRTGSMTPAPPDVIQSATSCRPIWHAIGDRRMNCLYTLCAASAWLDLGATGKAKSVLEEAIDAPHPYIDWLEAMIRANLAIAREDVAGARVALEQMDRLTNPAAKEGQFLLDLLRAGLLLIEGAPQLAFAAFERLVLDPVSERCPGLGSSAMTSQIRAACLVGDQEAIDALRVRYESRPFQSELHNLHFYGTLARFASAPEDYRRALKAIGSLAAIWRDPADKAIFIEAQRELIEKARSVLGADELLESIETQRAGSPTFARDKSYRRSAHRMMLVNAASLVPLFLLAFSMDKVRGAPVIFAAVMVALFTVLGAMYLLVDLVLANFVPSFKLPAGFILLALAVTPWVTGLMFGVTALFGP